MKWLFRLYVILALLALWNYASAHNDGTYHQGVTDGHVYDSGSGCPFVGAQSGSNNARRTPADSAQCRVDTTALIVSYENLFWDAANSRFSVTYRFTDNGTSTTFITEKHCPVGQVYDESSHVCVVNLGSACDYGGEFSYQSNSAGTSGYANLEDDVQGHACLFDLTASIDNGDGTYTIIVDDTLWHSADEDDFTTAPNDGDPIPNAPEPIESPFFEHGAYGGLPAAQRCDSSLPAVTAGYDDPSPDPDPDTMCMHNGCQASRVGVAVCAGGDCSASWSYTGETCTGSEDVAQGGASGAGSGYTDLTGVESRLDAIYSRLGNQTDALIAGQVLQTAVLRDAIEDSGGGGGGDSECADSSCDGTVPADGDPVGGIATDTQDFWDRVEASPIVSAFADLGTSFPTGSCSAVSTDPIEIFQGTSAHVISTDAHCSLWAEFAGIIQAVMLVVWIFTAGFILMRA